MASAATPIVPEFVIDPPIESEPTKIPYALALVSEEEVAKAEASTLITPRFDTNPPPYAILIPTALPVVSEPLPATLITPSAVFVIVPDSLFSTNIPVDCTASILIIPLFVIFPSTEPAFTP